MRYLMRGAISPLSQYDPNILAVRDIIGTNSGNLLYLYSVCRTLYNESASFEMDEYRIEAGKWSQEDIERINSKYDAYICPLADAFRPDFISKLKNFARFFNQLHIPVVISGMCIRAPLNADPATERYVFDEEAKEFLRAALDHGAIVGLRGEITGRYLMRLGFQEEKDWTVIGCPSMFSCPDGGGPFSKILAPQINSESRILVNCNFNDDKIVNSILDRIMRNYPNSCFVGQHTDDFNTFYYGLPHHSDLTLYPNSIDHFMVAEDRMKFYVHAQQWIDDVKGYDLSIGNRLHGNVASLLGGVPSILFLSDARSLEVSRYHGIPMIDGNTMLKNDALLPQILEKADFSLVSKRFPETFRHYLDFWKKNGIPTAYNELGEKTTSRFDSELVVPNLLKPYVECSLEETAKRHVIPLKKYHDRTHQQEEKIKTLSTQIGELNSKNRDLNAKNVELTNKNRDLNAKNVELTNKNKELQKKTEQYKKANSILRQSFSFRIGRFITWLPRKIRSLFSPG